MKIKRFVIGMFASVFAVICSSFAMAQEGNIVVTPTDTKGWGLHTTFGGSVSFIEYTREQLETTPPQIGNGAIRLTTDSTIQASALLGRKTNTPLLQIKELSYYTRQVEGPIYAAPYYYLEVCLETPANGKSCTKNSYTVLTYEPYWNSSVLKGDWQPWNVYAGKFWSSKNYSSGACSVTAGAGGPPSYTLLDLQSNCPNAVVTGYGVGIGSYNPSYVVETDLINFNGTTYDFKKVN